MKKRVENVYENKHRCFINFRRFLGDFGSPFGMPFTQFLDPLEAWGTDFEGHGFSKDLEQVQGTISMPSGSEQFF